MKKKFLKFELFLVKSGECTFSKIFFSAKNPLPVINLSIFYKAIFKHTLTFETGFIYAKTTKLKPCEKKIFVS